MGRTDNAMCASVNARTPLCIQLQCTWTPQVCNIMAFYGCYSWFSALCIVFFISSNDLLVNESDFASYDTAGQLRILSARGGWVVL